MGKDSRLKRVTVDGLDLETFTFVQSCIQRVANPLKNWLIPTALLRKLLADSESPLLKESVKKPGGWGAMEVIYRNDPPKNFLDKMAVTYSPYSIDIRNRRIVVSDRLTRLIRHHAADGHRPLMIGVGGGPGRNMLESMAKAREITCTGVVIDLDDEAFDYGRNLQKEMGLEGRVEYIRGDARDIRKVVDHSPDIVKIVGLFDYLNDEHAEDLLEVMYDVLTDGGSILATSLFDARNNGPFLKRAFNWNLNFRTGEVLEGLMEQAGFKVIEKFETPLGIYNIITGRKEK